MNAKNHLERILYIDTAIRNKVFPAKKRFVEHFEVSAKTIERDFEYLRERLGAPLEYSNERRGYYYSDENYFLPSLTFSEDELFALSLSLETVNSLGSSELTQSLSDGFDKIFKFLPDRVKRDLDIISSRSLYVGPPPSKMNVEVWRKLIKAIIMNSVINISYKAPGHEKPVERRLCPYYLLINKGMWYILTNNKIRNRIETYAVHRISKIEILSEHFSIPSDFKIEDHIDKDWGIFSHEEKYDIEIKFNQYIATHIKEKVWPGSYEITETPEGDITLRFTTNQLESVLFWLLPWGAGAKVINPPELKEMVLEVVEGMMELYSNP